ncbi:MAG: ATP-binding protein, partial [Anaerolineae bacterium]
LQGVASNPAWQLDVRADVSSLYSRSLSTRFVIVSLPVVALSVLFSVFAVTNRSLVSARGQALREMDRSAVGASDHIRQFYITGRSLVDSLSRQPQVISDDTAVRDAALAMGLRAVPFFQQLFLVRNVGEEFSIAAATPSSAISAELTVEELDVLQMIDDHDMGMQQTRLMELPLDTEYGQHGYSVAARVQVPQDGGAGAPDWYLVGRALFDIHPEIQGALAILSQIGEQGSGFVVDEYNLVAAHPDPSKVRTVWKLDEQAQETAWGAADDIAYEAVTPAGEHVLVYVHTLDNFSQKVVVTLPYIAVLRTAAQTAWPLLIVQLTFGLLLLVLIPFLASRITRPLNSLALAANRMARGNLVSTVDIAGEDEVAQLGDAFEQMRIRLQARLNDLSLLLSTAQKVSATLDFERGIVPILEGAMTATSAVVARFVVLRGNRKSRKIFSVGGVPYDLSGLDRALAAALSQRREPLVTNVDETHRAHDDSQLRAVAAFPVRCQDRTAAILWVGADQLHVFDEARVNFLSTLVSQAAVLMENARLFQTAEGGRQRLAAILASTQDAILVVDSEGRLLLSNPAAQRLLDIDRSAIGRSMRELELPGPLLEALANQTTTARRVRRYQLAVPESMRSAMTGGDEQLPSVEVPLDDGRTFYASAAPIRSDEGVTVGVFVVMRDVTHFKQLDEMKSEFVATVSHDLRAPLTFMRGYTTMLSMVGDLNDRQRDYMQRILEGIEQMNTLIGDLLDLRRVEAGVDIQREPCRLGLILVEAVESMRARATSKAIDLRLEPSEGSPTVIGDRTLLRQAVSNLVDNAIKYTPSGGKVYVGLDTTENEAVIRVSDTGIGIAPPDQVRLFEKFYRIKRREAGNIQGKGLGLALVKSIVERHGGHIWVESVLNKGSTFYIEIPLPTDDTPLL